MTQQEIEEAIKNGESVWACRNNIVYKVALDSSWVYIENDILKWYSPVNKILGHKYYSINELYKTQAEAEHYLHHANVTRTETLPFMTWEEFDKGITLCFIGYDRHAYRMFKKKLYGERIEDCLGEFIVLENDTAFSAKYYDLTEANFYKAYDECVRLFRSEE